MEELAAKIEKILNRFDKPDEDEHENEDDDDAAIIRQLQGSSI
jgi:hypothetical protein